MLKPHAKKCKCSICNEEDIDASKTEKKVAGAKAADELNLNDPKEVPTTTEEPNLAKRKKSDKDEGSKRAKVEENVATDITSDSQSKDETQKVPVGKTMADQDKTVKATANTPTKPHGSSSVKPGDVLSPATLSSTKTTTAVSSISPAVSTISTFSPSSTDSLSPTFISLSTTPQISPKTSILGSSVIPFPSKLSGIPSPSAGSLSSTKPPVAPVTVGSTASYTSPTSSIQTSPALSHAKFEAKPTAQSQLTKPQIAIQMGPPKLESSSIMSSGLPLSQPHHQGSFQMQRSRLGAVMQVRCKAVSAFLYTTKYESGSKGKCILLGEEWLTPNEFEEKSGSKAKKYLSSIKCLGRPLRAYVNSGELRGSGPSPSPKPQRLNKPKPPQAIAPAPPPGQGHSQLNMAQIAGMQNPGMSTGHMAQSYTPVAMMGGVSVAGQPILINQSNFSNASSMANTGMNQSNLGTPILAPMTFTLAPMSGVDQRQGMGVQQMHTSHHM